VAVLAFWKGGWRERVVGVAILIEFVTENDCIVHLHYPVWYVPACDLITLVICVICALRSDRYWTIGASSFALLRVVTQLMRFARGVGPWAYMCAERVWGVLIVAVLLVGVWSAVQPRARPVATGA